MIKKLRIKLDWHFKRKAVAYKRKLETKEGLKSKALSRSEKCILTDVDHLFI